MKKYIKVQPKQSSKGKIVVLLIVSLLAYGLVEAPAEMAEILQAASTALAAVAESIIELMRGL